MRAAAFVVGVLASVTLVSAECPNQCSGHGSCGNDDICACYKMWGSADCSTRECPSRYAFGDVKDTTVTNRAVHHYAECSNRGRCDSETGQCICDAGFEGEGCERLSCPGGPNCNGHGVCELMSSVNSAYTAWDADKLTVCVCDPGYEGHDCMDRKCKLGDDPISRYDSAGAAEADAVQTITLTTTTSFGAGSTFLLGYTDWRGEEWLTRPITVATTANGMSATEIKEALTTLPQRAIDDVTVAVTTDTTTSKVITITFSSSETPGPQPTMNLYTDGCTSNGCQPYYAGVTFTGGEVTNTLTTTTTGTAERAVCSNRGKCDSELGECVCFNGYSGHACENQQLVL